MPIGTKETPEEINTEKSAFSDCFNLNIAKIAEILGMTKEIAEANKEIKEIFLKFKNQIKSIREEIDYDYEDYEKRLCISDEVFSAEYEKLTSTGKLGKIYEEIIEISGLGKIIGKKLKEEYLEDLVFEGLEIQEEYKEKPKTIVEITGKSLKDIFSSGDLDLLNKLKGVKSIDLRDNKLGELSEKELEAMFTDKKTILTF